MMHSRHRAAVEEGIVAGGGVALLRAKKCFKLLKLTMLIATGIQIVSRVEFH
jgi:chaperonin GroEL